MKFSRVASLFIGFISIGLIGAVTALPAEKRQLSSILDIVTLLLGLLSPVLSILGGLGLGTLTSSTGLLSPVTQLTSVLGVATSALSLLGSLGSILMKREDQVQDAQVFAQVITEIITTFEPLTTNPNLPEMISSIAPVDSSIKSLLDEANAASPGILPLIAQDLTPDVIAALQQLSFTQTTGDLGI